MTKTDRDCRKQMIPKGFLFTKVRARICQLALAPHDPTRTGTESYMKILNPTCPSCHVGDKTEDAVHAFRSRSFRRAAYTCVSHEHGQSGIRELFEARFTSVSDSHLPALREVRAESARPIPLAPPLIITRLPTWVHDCGVGSHSRL